MEKKSSTCDDVIDNSNNSSCSDDESSCSSSSSSRSSCQNNNGVVASYTDIEELHTQACQRGETSYIDPLSGFTCFTELLHLKRGKCCGNSCRHCPYGYENVVNNNNGASRTTTAKCRSGDVVTAKRLLDEWAESGKTKSENTSTTENGAKEETADDRKTSTANNEDVQDDAVLREKTGANTVTTCSSDDNLSSRLDEDQDHESTTNNNDNDTSTNTVAIVVGKGRGGRLGGRYTQKNVPYTRKGDDGTSMLFTGEYRRKNDLVFEAMGTVDEVTSLLGVVYAELTMSDKHTSSFNRYGPLPDWMLQVMSRLMDVGSHIAKPRKKQQRNGSNEKVQISYDGVGGHFDPDHTKHLEQWIDIMTEELPELDSFLLPTGGRAASQCHVARTVCRRAERLLVELVFAANNSKQQVYDVEIVRYMNRLSDFCFTAARYANACEHCDEIMYKRHVRSDKQRTIVIQTLKQTSSSRTTTST